MLVYGGNAKRANDYGQNSGVDKCFRILSIFFMKDLPSHVYDGRFIRNVSFFKISKKGR